MKLLEKIWGEASGTVRAIMFRKVGTESVGHKFFTTNKEAIQFASTLTNFDVWFAPSLFAQNERKQDQVLTTRALWLDVDAGEGKDYATVDQAYEATETFFHQSRLPVPTIVESGNGLHVYWILDRELSPDEWKPLAQQLKAVCVKHNFKADPSVTADSARVLRVPGTKNFKDPENPKDVELASEIIEHSTDEIIKTLGVEAPAPVTAPSFLKVGVTKKNFQKYLPEETNNPKDANLIADKCAQLRNFRDTKGQIPEPLWYAGLGVLVLCENGEEIAHEWSKGDSSYTRSGTEDKISRAREFAPSTCARFRSVDAGDCCASCPFLDKIATPLQLGEYVKKEEVKIERIVEEKVEEVKLEVPKNYEVGTTGVFFEPPAKIGEPPQRFHLIRNPLWVSRVMLNESGGESEVELVYYNQRGREKRAAFKQALLAQPQAMNAWLKSHNIQVITKQLDAALIYIEQSIRVVNNKWDEETVFDRFGWHETGFIIGQERVHTSGIAACRISETVDRRRLLRLGVKGDHTAWSNASRLLDAPNFWMHRFAVCSMLAAPLLHLSESEGSVLSLSGESSGGKTTSAIFGLSAFGLPKAMTINPQSTENAFYELWRLLSNLPVLCNEAATMDPRMLGQFVYAAANGEARDKLTRDGKMKEAGTFSTVTCLTNNKHLLAMPEKVLNEATRRRILELTFNQENVMPLIIGQELNRVAHSHYGGVGRMFLQEILRDRAMIETRLLVRIGQLEQGINSANRYNIWLVAAASVAWEIGFKLGLIQFDFADALANVLDQIRSQDDSVLATAERVSQAIGRYVMQFQGYFTKKRSGKTQDWIEEGIRGEVRGRYTCDFKGNSAVLALPVAQFQEWAMERNVDVNHIKTWAREKGIDKHNERIAPHTEPVLCWTIPIGEKVELEKMSPVNA